MVTNRRLVPSEGPNFYPTPEWGTRALLKYEKFEGGILEPCCGDGAMAEVLKEAGYSVLATDLYDWGYGDTGIDFLTLKGDHVNNVITNPPYNIAEEIFHKAYEIAYKKVALLLRVAFLESVKRYNTIYKLTPPKRLLVFSQRLSMYPKNYPVKGGGTTSYAWFIWEKGFQGSTIIDWIEPGLKE